MSYEAWGDTSEREPQVCLLCDQETYTETCPLCQSVRRANKAEALLKRAMLQLEKWHNWFGKYAEKSLPPAGDVTLMEDVDEFFTHNK